jgi:hypothetical protein
MDKKNKKVGISIPVLARSDVPHAVHRSISSAAAFALANLTFLKLQTPKPDGLTPDLICPLSFMPLE